MKRGWLAALLAAATVLPMAARGADDTKTPDAPPAKTVTSTPTTPAKLKGRLPPYFAKLPVDAQQKEKIYAIQAEFAPQLKALREQLAKLEADENSQIKAVLTPEQQQKLKELMAESKHHGKPSADGSKTAPGEKPTTATTSSTPNTVPAPVAK